MEILAFAVPFFIAFLIFEIIYDQVKHKGYYRLNDTVNNISMGIMQQAVHLFINLLLFGAYYYLYENASIQVLFGAPSISLNSVFWWIFTFFFVDFLYYWYHRKSHENGFLWASHVVHHQSEEYNLAVALRQGTFQVFFTFFFFLPAPLLGFPPEMFVTCYVIGVVYQFWIHTRTIPKLGPIEWVFNTPSHHRVHHGRNPKYIDRNHAGVFIIWDRMFGTYQEEEEEPIYGITKPMDTWNPVWLNLQEYMQLGKMFVRTKSWKDKLRIFTTPPGWRPADIGPMIQPQEIKKEDVIKFDITPIRSIQIYIGVQFALTLAAFQPLMDFMETAPYWQSGVFVFFVILTLTNLGGLLESKRWAWFSEFARIMTISLMGLIIPYKLEMSVLISAAAGFCGLLFLAWLMHFSRYCIEKVNLKVEV